MPSIRKAFTRFSPWLTIVAVYLVLGLAGRTFLWVKFGLEADVGAARLPYILTAGFINDLVREFPMEYSVELKRLIDLEMEGSVG